MSLSPHTPLYSAKASILAKVKECLYGQTPKHEITTLRFQLENIELWSLIGHLNHAQKVFFANREGKAQYLGVKFLRIFNSAFAIENARYLLEENSDLVILGGQRFHTNKVPAPEWSDLGSHYYVIPQFLFQTINGKTELLINIPIETYSRANLSMALLLDLEHLFAFKGHHRSNLDFMTCDEIPERAQWDQQVDLAKLAFANKDLEKVVLSRKKVLTSGSNLKPDDILNELTTRKGEHFIFHLQWRSDRAFTSITPERLFKLEAGELISDAIAGTRPRGIDGDSDQTLERELHSSPKELSEHRFVTTAVKTTMHKLGAASIEIDGAPEQIMKLTHVQHLHTRLKATLNQVKRTSEIIDAFHPTPAVGGTPKIDASEWLAESEKYDRGFYAAPLGVITANHADFCVGIRSALTFGRELHIYAGAGIIAASSAEQEWIETANKMKNFPFAVTPIVSLTNGPVSGNTDEQHPIN